MSTDARTAKRAAMRRATLQLVSGVVALDAVALLGYHFVIAHSDQRTKMIFTGVWTVATVFLVAFLLRRVRRARYAAYSS